MLSFGSATKGWFRALPVTDAVLRAIDGSDDGTVAWRRLSALYSIELMRNTQAQMHRSAVSLPAHGKARRQHSTASSRRPWRNSASAKRQFGPASVAAFL